jgi:hypothetical protein
MEIRQILLFLDYVIFRLFGSLSVVQLSIDIVNLTYIVSLGASNLQLAGGASNLDSALKLEFVFCKNYTDR